MMRRDVRREASAAQKRADDVAEKVQRFTDLLLQKYDDLTDAFQALDLLNRSAGHLTMVEFQVAANDIGYIGDVRPIFYALNTKRDGCLELREFLQIASIAHIGNVQDPRGRATSRERRKVTRTLSSPGDGRGRTRGGLRTQPLKLTSSNLDALQLDLDSSGDLHALLNSSTNLRSPSPLTRAAQGDDASAYFCELWEEWTSRCSEAITSGDDLPEPPQVPRTKDVALRLVARTTWAARKLVGELASRGGETRHLQKTVADVQSDLSKSKADARKLCDRVSELMRVHQQSLKASHEEVAALQQKVQDLMAAAPTERAQGSAEWPSQPPVSSTETVFNEHGRLVQTCDKCAKFKAQLKETQLDVQRLRQEKAKMEKKEQEFSREMASIQIRAHNEHDDVQKAVKKSEAQRALTVEALRQIIDRFSHKIGSEVLKESLDSSRRHVPSFGHNSPRDRSPASSR